MLLYILYRCIHTSACVWKRRIERLVQTEIMRRPLKNVDENAHKREAHVQQQQQQQSQQLWRRRWGGSRLADGHLLRWFLLRPDAAAAALFLQRLISVRQNRLFPVLYTTHIICVYTSCYYVPLYIIYYIVYKYTYHMFQNIVHTHTHTTKSHILVIYVSTSSASHTGYTHVVFCYSFPRTRTQRYAHCYTAVRYTRYICDGVIFSEKKPPSSGFKLISKRSSAVHGTRVRAPKLTTQNPLLGRSRIAAGIIQ